MCVCVYVCLAGSSEQACCEKGVLLLKAQTRVFPEHIRHASVRVAYALVHACGYISTGERMFLTRALDSVQRLWKCNGVGPHGLLLILHVVIVVPNGFL